MPQGSLVQFGCSAPSHIFSRWLRSITPSSRRNRTVVEPNAIPQRHATRVPLPQPCEQPALEKMEMEISGSTGLQDYDDKGSSSAGNGTGSGSGIGNCNSEESDDDDDDDAIARLFSIGGVKRRRISDSHQQANDRDSVRHVAHNDRSSKALGAAGCKVSRCTSMFFGEHRDSEMMLLHVPSRHPWSPLVVAPSWAHCS